MPGWMRLGAVSPGAPLVVCLRQALVAGANRCQERFTGTLMGIYSVDMTKSQLTRIGAIATIGGGVVTLHGVTSGHWRRAHTVFATAGWVVGFLSFVEGHRSGDVAPRDPTTTV